MSPTSLAYQEQKTKSWSGNYFKAKRKPLSFLFDLGERDRREDDA
jgi:hypothetical protein